MPSKIDHSMKSGDEVELEEMCVILRIPKEAVSLELTVGILDDAGELRKVSSSLTASGIRDARQDFLDNVELGDDYDSVFVLTEDYLQSLVEDGDEQ